MYSRHQTETLSSLNSSFNVRGGVRRSILDTLYRRARARALHENKRPFPRDGPESSRVYIPTFFVRDLPRCRNTYLSSFIDCIATSTRYRIHLYATQRDQLSIDTSCAYLHELNIINLLITNSRNEKAIKKMITSGTKMNILLIFY